MISILMLLSLYYYFDFRERQEFEKSVRRTKGEIINMHSTTHGNSVLFCYRVNDRLFYDWQLVSYEYAERITPGMEVVVKYDPANPENGYFLESK